ncbi:MAG: hypothetical protein GWN61_10810, partial [candidate division Zixibacteria bacterium]|nr:hypothetical protein [candidate division Zixibacteria bacterium]
VVTLFVFSLPTRAGLFDDRFPSARTFGMGGSGVAMNTDVWAAYYNPAALSRSNQIQIGTAYLRLFNLSFLKNYFGAGIYPLPGNYGSLSLNFQYFGVDYEGENLTGESTFALSHGFYLLDDVHSSLAFGYSLKAYHLTYGTTVEGRDLGSATTLGLDVGLQASLYSRTYVGVYFLNINAPTVGVNDKEDLPQRIVAGIAYQPYSGVTTSLDFNRLLGEDEVELWGGAEFRVFEYIFLRFGGSTNPNRFS